jgi:hypothetical protein
LQALGSVTAMVRLTGTPSGTLPVRMRQAQPLLAFISAPRERQQSAVGEAVLLMMKLRHGAKLETSDVVHDSGPATCCPDTTGTTGEASAIAATATASSLSTFRPAISIPQPCSYRSLLRVMSTWLLLVLAVIDAMRR